MTVAELYELIAKGETERVEMTRAFDKADKIGQAICAFANDFADSGEAGILLLGVENNGEISGRRIEDKQLASLGGLKSDGNLFPPPSMSVEKLTLPEGDVVAVTVFPSRYPPIKYNGQVWIRLGARKALANEEDIHLLVERRSRYGIRDEELPCDRAKFEELEIDLFKNFYLPRAIDAQVIEADDRPILEQMTSLRFFNQEKNCPTNLGALLFAKHPERFIPSAYIQYVKFAGDDNASDILQESVFRGPLVKVVQDLDVFVKTGPAASRPVLVTALREEMVAQYPSWALRELVLNAIIHRDYFFGNAPIKFYEYANSRIEISNPGGLFGRVNPKNFPFANDYRNPLLAEAMKVLGFVNKYNRGISKVNKELESNGNPHAQFDVNKLTEFRVTVVASQSGTIKSENGQINGLCGQIKPESGTINDQIKVKSGQIKCESGTIKPEGGTINGQIKAKSGTINEQSGTINGQIKANSVTIKPQSGTINGHINGSDVNGTESQDKVIFKIVCERPNVKAKEIVLATNASLRTVNRSLKRLVAANKIEYRGSKKTGGWYVRT